MMKLTSFKVLKWAVVVICMLAAGICYSCSMRNSGPGPESSALVLETSDRLAQGKGKGKGDSDPGQAKAEADVNADEAGENAGPAAGGEPVKSAGAGKDARAGAREGTGQYAGIEAGGEPGESGGAGRNAGAAGYGDFGMGQESQDASLVYVHVCGLVCSPGVYGLPAGSRVYEAIEAAGGFAKDAAPDYLNLAGVLEDGMKLQIPDRAQADQWMAQGLPDAIGQAGVRGGAQISQGGTKAVSKVNLNTASREELMTLRGIGESRAEDIIRYRDTFGGFKSIEDIMNVSGIKNAAFEKIKDSITV